MFPWLEKLPVLSDSEQPPPPPPPWTCDVNRVLDRGQEASLTNTQGSSYSCRRIYTTVYIHIYIQISRGQEPRGQPHKYTILSLHIFKIVGYRNLANIRKFMQICKPVVPKKMPFHFLGKMSLPQTVYFSISNC